MSYYFAGVLSKEFTCIPHILSECFGKFYSNALCNGCTWLFVIWYILHTGLDYGIDEVLRKMRYKEYNRIRLKNSLWYLGFYCTVFVHTGATNYLQNRLDLSGLRKTNVTTYNDLSSDVVTGFMVMFTFFLHSAFWEVMEYDSKTLFLSYILLCSVLMISFILRTLEFAFTLAAFISIAQVSLQSAKLLYVLTKQDNSYLRIIVAIFFGLGVGAFCLSYLVGVPLVFLIPFFRKIITAHLPSGFIPLTLLLGGWYISEIGNSPIFKLLGHWLFHTEKTNECCGNIVECSLFPPRNDIAFNLLQLRKEIKEREERKLSLRRTSKRGVLVQTIKCMVSLKRKINAKRAATQHDETDTNDESDQYSIEPARELDNDDERKVLLASENVSSMNSGDEKKFETKLLDTLRRVVEKVEELENEKNNSSTLLDFEGIDEYEGSNSRKKNNLNKNDEEYTEDSMSSENITEDRLDSGELW